ncbi:MAG: hypothetical protein CMJ18_19935, partial [Phycisphaeraceae bacterium]|nr:hypothetical protein [Phycisphaeraceae bacterium]
MRARRRRAAQSDLHRRTMRFETEMLEPRVLLSGETLVADLGDLPVGKAISIQFDAAVEAPLGKGIDTVHNQATVSGDNFADILTEPVTTMVDRAPQVTGVFINGAHPDTGWSQDFRDFLASTNQGDATFGRRIANGPGQLDALAWINIDELSIRFSEPVDIKQSDLALAGTTLVDLVGFRYDPGTDTATWRLGAPLGTNRLRVMLDATANGVTDIAGNQQLDGEWVDGTSTGSSGDGVAGGDFSFRLDVLAGDANGDRTVTVTDVVIVGSALGQSTDGTSTGTTSRYDASFDVTGNGTINIGDVSNVTARIVGVLPTEEPGGVGGTGWTSRVDPPDARPPAVAGDLAATKIGALADDVDGDGRADPGDTIRYEISIANDGAAEALAVRVTDTVDVNTTLGHVGPAALPDMFTAVAGKTLTVPTAAGVRANDFDLDAITPNASLIVTPIVSGATALGGTIDLGSDGSFTYGPPAGAVDVVDTFTYEVADEHGLVSTGTAMIMVQQPSNTPPVLAPIGDRSVDEQQPLSFDVLATDTDVPANDLTFSLDAGAPTGATIDPVTGAFAWTPVESQGPDEFTITVRVADDGIPALEDLETIRITVNEVNAAPVLDAIGNRQVNKGNSLEFTAAANDADVPGNALTFSLDAGAPAGAVIDPVTGQFSFTPTATQPSGTVFVTVRVTDDGAPALDDAETIAVTVDEAPPIILVEQTDFTVEHAQPITIPQEASTLVFTYDLTFDPSDSFVNDAFEAALLGADGHSLVHTIAAVDRRDAYFNVTEGQTVAVGVNTQTDVDAVSLDLSHLPAGTEATLVLRLVNNDADTTTTVEIFDITVVQGSLGTPIGAAPSSSIAPSAGPIDFSSLSDVSDAVATPYGRTSFDTSADTLFATLSLANQESFPVDAPLLVAIDHLSDPTVTVLNADGVTPDGLPYLGFSALMAGGTLDSGATTTGRDLALLNPGGERFTYDLVVLGQVNRDPNFISDPDLEALPGRTYAYAALARDPDLDPLHYTLQTAPQGMNIDADTGLIEWAPQLADVGNRAVVVEVEDGRGGRDVQSFTLAVRDNVPNRPPIITSTPVVDAQVGVPYTYPLTAIDPDGDVLSYRRFEAFEVPVSNPSFEAQVLADGGVTSNVIADWALIRTARTGGGVYNPLATEFLQDVPDGDNVAYNIGATIAQTLSTTLESRTTYTLEVAIGNRAGVLGFPGYAVQLLAGDTVLVEESSSTPAEGTFVTATLVYEAPVNEPRAGAPLEIRLLSSGNQVIFDDVRLGAVFGKSVEGMSIDPAGLLEWTPQTDQTGPHEVTAIASDGRGGRAVQAFTVQVGGAPGNHAPVITSEPVTQASSPGGRIVVANDEWTLSAAGFGRTPVDAAVYAANVADWFLEGSGRTSGRFHALSVNFGLTGQQLATVMASAGHDWTTGTSIDSIPVTFDVPTLLQFDGVYLAGGVSGIDFLADADVLIEYVKRGGNVYVAAGTSRLGGSANEANTWNAFLNAFGLAYDTRFNTGTLQIDIDSPHPIFDGVTGLYQAGGNGIFDLDPTSIANEVLVTAPDFFGDPAGMYAVFDPLNDSSAAFAYAYQVQAADADEDVLVYALVEAPNTMTIDSDTGLIRWRPLGSETQTVTVRVEDGRGGFDEQTFVLDVRADNLAPLFTSDPITVVGTLPPPPAPETFDGFTFALGAQAFADRVVQYARNGVDVLSPFDDPSRALGVPGADDDVVSLGDRGVLVLEFLDNALVDQTDEAGGADLVIYDTFDTFREAFQVEISANGADWIDLGFVGTGSGPTGTSPYAIDIGPFVNPVDVFRYVRMTDFITNQGNVPSGEGDINAVGTIGGVPTSFVYAYDAEAIDLNGDPLTFSLEQAPAGMTIDAATGLVVWTSVDLPIGTAPVTLRVEDDKGQSDTQSFAVEVFDGRLGELGGQVFEDVDGDGTRDVDPVRPPAGGDPVIESGIESVVVYLDRDDDDVRDADEPFTLTGADGDYLFTDLIPGTHVVRHEAPLGLLTTAPTNGEHVVALGDGASLSGFDFGDRLILPTENQSPRFVSAPFTDAISDRTYVYRPTVEDPDGDVLEFDLATGPEGMGVTSDTGMLAWIPSARDVGVHEVVIVVRDPLGGSDVQSFRIGVTAENVAPTITSVPFGPAVIDVLYRYEVTAQDGNGDTLAFRLDEAPNGMSIDGVTGVLTWTPQSDQVGPHPVEIVVDDGRGGLASQAFELPAVLDAANDPPAITSQPPGPALALAPYVYPVVAEDPNGDTLEFSLGPAPIGMTIDPQTGLVAWQPEVDDVGMNGVVVKVADGRGGGAIADVRAGGRGGGGERTAGHHVDPVGTGAGRRALPVPGDGRGSQRRPVDLPNRSRTRRHDDRPAERADPVAARRRSCRPGQPRPGDRRGRPRRPGHPVVRPCRRRRRVERFAVVRLVAAGTGARRPALPVPGRRVRSQRRPADLRARRRAVGHDDRRIDRAR